MNKTVYERVDELECQMREKEPRAVVLMSEWVVRIEKLEKAVERLNKLEATRQRRLEKVEQSRRVKKVSGV